MLREKRMYPAGCNLRNKAASAGFNSGPSSPKSSKDPSLIGITQA
jgi:hypothetical protein